MARKSVHVGMGIICLSFPWLFDSVLAVQVLAGIAIISLLIVRITKLRKSVGSALFSVDRISIGELLFPLAVAWLFTLGWDKPVIYCISLLLLTLADTAGALAGSKYGKKSTTRLRPPRVLKGHLPFLSRPSFALPCPCISICTYRSGSSFFCRCALPFSPWLLKEPRDTGLITY